MVGPNIAFWIIALVMAYAGVRLVTTRNVVHAALFVPIWWRTTDRTLGDKRLLVLRGVFGLLALESYAWTLGKMALADAWILQ